MTPTITIKPLQWSAPFTNERVGMSEWICALPEYRDHQRLYEIRSFEDEPGFYLWFTAAQFSHRIGDGYPTLEAAQAAAQKDWEWFVRAAIQS